MFGVDQHFIAILIFVIFVSGIIISLLANKICELKTDKELLDDLSKLGHDITCKKCGLTYMKISNTRPGKKWTVYFNEKGFREENSNDIVIATCPNCRATRKYE